MLEIFQVYRNLILQTSLSVSFTLILTFLKIPTFFLYGLYTYIHPDQTNTSGARAAIRRPPSGGSASGVEGYQSLSSRTSVELKRKSKSKEKFEFDENNAQIFRVKLDEGHLQTRLFFKEYHNSFVLSFVAISSLLLYKYLGESNDSGLFANGIFIPFIFGVAALCKVFMSLARVSFEKSASKRSEKQFSLIIGALGFLCGLMIWFGVVPLYLDFDFRSIDGFWRFYAAVLMGFFAGFLYIPAGKNARSFWLGTDQLRCNLSIVSCGWFARILLYANYLLNVFTALLWINPFAEFLVNKNIDDVKGAHEINSAGEAESLVGNVGFSRSHFARLRLLCLLLSGLLQIPALRPNMQMFLNEAVLSWYQRLHASKVPELDYSRAKVFLHNHYLCLAVLQFFSPPVLLLLFLGLSQIDGSSFEKQYVLCGLLPCHALLRVVALFMAWWIVFLWAVFTSASLLFYRRGVLYVS